MIPKFHVRQLFRTSVGVLAALSLTGCGSGGSGDSAGGEGASGDNEKLKVAMVIDSPSSDGCWGASCYQAMTDAASDLGWDTAYSESVAQADWGTNMQNYVDQGYDLIFMPGNEFSDTVTQVAADNPDSKFAILNDTVQSDNVEGLMPDNEQIGLLAGALAGLLTKTESIGFIGGVELDTTKAKLENYEKAAKKMNENVQVFSAYAGSFSDAAKGKELANSMAKNNKVDVMFGDASIVDTGAREALAEFADTYDIGQPSNMGSEDDPLIATSVVTDNKTMLEQSMKDVENDEFGNKVIMGDLSNGGVSVGTVSKIVPSDVQDEYTTIVDQIKDGSFV